MFQGFCFIAVPYSERSFVFEIFRESSLAFRISEWSMTNLSLWDGLQSEKAFNLADAPNDLLHEISAEIFGLPAGKFLPDLSW